MTAHRMLEPTDPPSADEICRCRSRPPVKLMVRLDDNPIACLRCDLEVPPRRLRLDRATTKEVEDWGCVYGALYKLWLLTDKYESWAARQLRDLTNEINVAGRSACRSMQRFRRCYYLHFQDLREQEQGLPRRCPSCGRQPKRLSGVRIDEMAGGRCVIVWFAASEGLPKDTG